MAFLKIRWNWPKRRRIRRGNGMLWLATEGAKHQIQTARQRFGSNELSSSFFNNDFPENAANTRRTNFNKNSQAYSHWNRLSTRIMNMWFIHPNFYCITRIDQKPKHTSNFKTRFLPLQFTKPKTEPSMLIYIAWTIISI